MAMLPRVLITECLKLKRTLALWMVLVAPSVVVLLYFLVGHFGAGQMIERHRNYAADLTQNATMLWTILMMPLFITLETSLLAGLEHTDKNWKNLLALPAPRWTIYVSKLIVTIALLWTAHLVLIAGVIACGHALMWLHPALMPSGLPLRPLVVPLAKISVAAMLAVTIQHWVSLRWQSFTAALGFGMCALVVGFLAVNSAEWGPRIPWSMPLHALRAHGTSGVLIVLLPSFIAAALVGAFGCWEFSRRDVNN